MTQASNLYLSTLPSEKDKEDSLTRLNRIACILSGGTLQRHTEYLWANINYDAVSLVIKTLKASGETPESVESHLKDIDKVMRFQYALGQIRLPDYNEAYSSMKNELALSENCPSSAYVKSLKSSGSRQSMTSILNQSVGILSDGKINDHDKYDWGHLSFSDIHHIQNILTEKSMSPKTLNTYLSALKGVAKYAYKLGSLNSKEFENIKEIKGATGSHHKKGRALSLQELNRLIDHCLFKDDPKSLRDAVIIGVTYGLGLRRSETATLKLSDYDSKSGTMSILGKRNKVRVQSLNARTVDMLETWLDLRGRHYEGTIFTRILKGGKVTQSPVTAQAIYDVVVSRYKEAGLTRLSPHDLRHTFATTLLKNKEDMRTVQELMGHENLSSTAVYTHVSEEDKRKASTRLPM